MPWMTVDPEPQQPGTGHDEASQPDPEPHASSLGKHHAGKAGKGGQQPEHPPGPGQTPGPTASPGEGYKTKYSGAQEEGRMLGIHQTEVCSKPPLLEGSLPVG